MRKRSKIELPVVYKDIGRMARARVREEYIRLQGAGAVIAGNL